MTRCITLALAVDGNKRACTVWVGSSKAEFMDSMASSLVDQKLSHECSLLSRTAMACIVSHCDKWQACAMGSVWCCWVLGYQSLQCEHVFIWTVILEETQMINPKALTFCVHNFLDICNEINPTVQRLKLQLSFFRILDNTSTPFQLLQNRIKIVYPMLWAI